MQKLTDIIILLLTLVIILVSIIKENMVLQIRPITPPPIQLEITPYFPKPQKLLKNKF